MILKKEIHLHHSAVQRLTLLTTWCLLLIKSSSFAFSNTPVALTTLMVHGTLIEKPRVIVIGGGPTGLSTALILANPPFTYNVDIYESSLNGGVYYDVSKSFVYNINPRGQELTCLFPSIQDKLQNRGVGLLKGFIVIPADPKVPIPKPQTMNVNSNKNNQKLSYWIPRHDFVVLLREAIYEHEQERIQCETLDKQQQQQTKGQITIHDGIVFQDLHFIQQQNILSTQIVVTLRKDETNIIWNETTSLVVGADGVNSMVRYILIYFYPL